MRVLVANHSSMPRPDAAPRADDEPGAPTRRVVDAQRAAGVDLPTDGQLAWTEGLTHVLAGVEGVRFETSARDASNGHEPIVEGKLRRRHARLGAEYSRARDASGIGLKAAVPGPYSLARLCRIATTAYREPIDLAADLADLLADEVRELARQGAPTIQVDEPAILQAPDDVRALRDLLEPLHIAGGDAEIVVATYGSDATALYAQLCSLPAHTLGFDCAGRAGLVETIAKFGCGKPLALGLVDGCGAALENPDAVARNLARALHRYVHDAVVLQPSCGLAGLPWDLAVRKLETLAEARRRFSG